MFKVHGLWVSPVEVEGVLMEHPGVLEAAVVGIKTDGFVRARAFVIARSPDAEDEGLASELRAHCERRLHGYQRPAAIEIVPDLPRTVTGKIQRFKLRQVDRLPGA
jgi:benzoate-CoA ligase